GAPLLADVPLPGGERRHAGNLAPALRIRGRSRTRARRGHGSQRGEPRSSGGAARARVTGDGGGGAYGAEAARAPRRGMWVVVANAGGRLEERSVEELEAGLDEVRASPRDEGTLRLIVRRP